MPERKEVIEIMIETDELITVPVERKRIKNIRLKVYPNGEVKISAPFGPKLFEIAEFARSRSEWVRKCLQKKTQASDPLIKIPASELMTVLMESVDRLYPIVKAYGVKRPSVSIRRMRTRWGSCSVHGGSIRLNAYLCFAEKDCVDYVVLHELTHFIYPDHSKSFYAFIERFMPDWKQRRERLKRISLPQ